jgi:hypothetical protein
MISLLPTRGSSKLTRGGSPRSEFRPSSPLLQHGWRRMRSAPSDLLQASYRVVEREVDNGLAHN